MKKNAIILVNWNGGNDTIHCLESIRSLKNVIYDVFILDNNSMDDSVNQLKLYFTKNFIEYGFIEIVERNESIKFSNAKQYCLIKSNHNFGFAGGNNLAIKVALLNGKYDYIWLLNNDTEVDENALSFLNQEIVNVNGDFIGSLIIDFFKRDTVQCIGGGKIYSFLGITKLIGRGLNINSINKNNLNIDYLMGASILFKSKMIDTVGYIDEEYFMYFEETDWQMKAQQAGFKLSVSLNSIVYHKGSVSTIGNKALYYYYYNRSAIIFTNRHYSKIILASSIIFLIAITLIKTRFDFRLFCSGMKGLIEGLRSI